LLRRADVIGKDDIIYDTWRISLFCGSGRVIEVTKYSVGQARNI